MKKIIDISTGMEVPVTQNSLPLMIHGKDRSGASFFTISLAAQFHAAGNKLLIFTAFQMAKEEFLNQVAETADKVFYLESENDFEKAKEFQTIYVQSGNIDLFMKILSQATDRIVFVKNIETIDQDIFTELSKHPFVVSGDVEVNPTQKVFLDHGYATKILFSPLPDTTLPALAKYQALLQTKSAEHIIALN
jgi:hypothetical protein